MPTTDTEIPIYMTDCSDCPCKGQVLLSPKADGKDKSKKVLKHSATCTAFLSARPPLKDQSVFENEKSILREREAARARLASEMAEAAERAQTNSQIEV